MSIVAVGINHKTAPVAVREKISFNPDNLSVALAELIGNVECREAAILSTCNRTELYLVQEGDVTITQEKVVRWLEQHHNVPASIITPSLYWHTDQQAVNHMMRVACGLDSLVLGEPQILGQMKQAYSQAKAAGSMSLVMDRLFQRRLISCTQPYSTIYLMTLSFASAFMSATDFPHAGCPTTLLTSVMVVIPAKIYHTNRATLSFAFNINSIPLTAACCSGCRDRVSMYVYALNPGSPVMVSSLVLPTIISTKFRRFVVVSSLTSSERSRYIILKMSFLSCSE